MKKIFFCGCLQRSLNAGEGCRNIAIWDRKQPFHLQVTEHRSGPEHIPKQVCCVQQQPDKLPKTVPVDNHEAFIRITNAA